MKNNNYVERFVKKFEFEFFEIDFIVQNIKKNNHIEFSIEKHDFVENELINDNFFNVNDFDKI